jgi:hypothetical protein
VQRDNTTDLSSSRGETSNRLAAALGNHSASDQANRADPAGVLLIIWRTSVRIMWHSDCNLDTCQLPIECSLAWKARFPLQSRPRVSHHRPHLSATVPYTVIRSVPVSQTSYTQEPARRRHARRVETGPAGSKTSPIWSSSLPNSSNARSTSHRSPKGSKLVRRQAALSFTSSPRWLSSSAT